MAHFKYYESLRNLKRMYGFVDVKDRTVLDIGADWGSTPHFFITRGAKSVIAVEGGRNHYDEMVKNLKDESRVLPIYLFIRETEDMVKLIKNLHPDIVKIDCEGCEQALVNVPQDVLRIPREYVIEIHSEELIESIHKSLNDGFDLCEDIPIVEGVRIRHYVRGD